MLRVCILTLLSLLYSQISKSNSNSKSISEIKKIVCAIQSSKCRGDLVSINVVDNIVLICVTNLNFESFLLQLSTIHRLILNIPDFHIGINMIDATTLSPGH